MDKEKSIGETGTVMKEPSKTDSTMEKVISDGGPIKSSITRESSKEVKCTALESLTILMECLKENSSLASSKGRQLLPSIMATNIQESSITLR